MFETQADKRRNEGVDNLLINTSEFFKDSLYDFYTNISANYDHEPNNYDKLVVDFVFNRLKKMHGSLIEQNYE